MVTAVFSLGQACLAAHLGGLVLRRQISAALVCGTEIGRKQEYSLDLRQRHAIQEAKGLKYPGHVLFLCRWARMYLESRQFCWSERHRIHVRMYR